MICVNLILNRLQNLANPLAVIHVFYRRPLQVEQRAIPVEHRIVDGPNHLPRLAVNRDYDVIFLPVLVNVEPGIQFPELVGPLVVSLLNLNALALEPVLLVLRVFVRQKVPDGLFPVESRPRPEFDFRLPEIEPEPAHIGVIYVEGVRRNHEVLSRHRINRRSLETNRDVLHQVAPARLTELLRPRLLVLLVGVAVNRLLTLLIDDFPDSRPDFRGLFQRELDSLLELQFLLEIVVERLLDLHQPVGLLRRGVVVNQRHQEHPAFIRNHVLGPDIHGVHVRASHG